MLSIQFDSHHEWWVSGYVFERLFRAALDAGTLAPDLAELLYVAYANGGLHLEYLEPEQARRFVVGLRRAAGSELRKLEGAVSGPQDLTYQVSMRKLVAIIDDMEARS